MVVHIAHGKGQVQVLAVLIAGAGDADDLAVFVQQRAAAAALGDGGADLDVGDPVLQAVGVGDDAHAQGVLQTQGAADGVDRGAAQGRVFRAHGQGVKVLPLDLQDGPVLVRVPGVDAGHGEDPPVDELDRGAVRPGDDMVVGHRHAVPAHEKAAAGLDGAALGVIDLDEEDGCGAAGVNLLGAQFPLFLGHGVDDGQGTDGGIVHAEAQMAGQVPELEVVVAADVVDGDALGQRPVDQHRLAAGHRRGGFVLPGKGQLPAGGGVALPGMDAHRVQIPIELHRKLTPAAVQRVGQIPQLEVVAAVDVVFLTVEDPAVHHQGPVGQHHGVRGQTGHCQRRQQSQRKEQGCKPFHRISPLYCNRARPG